MFIMTLSNSEQETLWVGGWNSLYEHVDSYPEAYILVPEYKEVSLEEAQGWIQDSAYNSYVTKFSISYYKGRKSIFLNKELA